MTKRFLITLHVELEQIARQMAKDDYQPSLSQFFAHLIKEEAARRKMPVKAVCRPPKPKEEEEQTPDYSDDLPKNVPYFGKMIGPREYEDIKARPPIN